MAFTIRVPQKAFDICTSPIFIPKDWKQFLQIALSHVRSSFVYKNQPTFLKGKIKPYVANFNLQKSEWFYESFLPYNNIFFSLTIVRTIRWLFVTIQVKKVKIEAFNFDNIVEQRFPTFFARVPQSKKNLTCVPPSDY